MLRLLVHILVLALVGLITPACASPTAPQRAEIGMTLHQRGADAESIRRQFDFLAAMKAKWVRVDIDWSVIEDDQGQFDWSYPDAIVKEAAARQMNVLAVLAFTPAWARSPDTIDSEYPHHFRPEDLSHYVGFARMAAERYAPQGVRSWQIWNEHNTNKFWPPNPDPDDYGKLFRAASAEIRGVDPEATLLIGGLSPQFEPPGEEVPPTKFLEQLYANGSAQLADAIAVHPYSFPAMPMEATERIVGEFKDLPALHAVMDRNGDGHKKIWITEYGAPTGTDPHAVSEEAQAATLLQARLQVERWDWVGPLIYYELVDGGTDPTDKEQNFGVLREDLSPKLAAVALMDSA